MILFIVLLVLKLTGVIAWSWWAITSPIWVCVILKICQYIIDRRW